MNKLRGSTPSALDQIANRKMSDNLSDNPANTPSPVPDKSQTPGKSTFVQRLVKAKMLADQRHFPHSHGNLTSRSSKIQQQTDSSLQLKKQFFGSEQPQTTSAEVIKALVKEGLIYGVVYQGAPELRIQTDAACELLTSIGVNFGNRPEGGRVIEKKSLLRAAGGQQYQLDDCLTGLRTGKRSEPMQLPDTGSKGVLY